MGSSGFILLATVLKKLLKTAKGFFLEEYAAPHSSRRYTTQASISSCPILT